MTVPLIYIYKFFKAALSFVVSFQLERISENMTIPKISIDNIDKKQLIQIATVFNISCDNIILIKGRWILWR